MKSARHVLNFARLFFEKQELIYKILEKFLVSTHLGDVKPTPSKASCTTPMERISGKGIP